MMRPEQELTVGAPVRMWWPDIGNWYAGCVGEHAGSVTLILYEDEQWLRPRDEKFEVLKPKKSNPRPPSRTKRGKMKAPRIKTPGHSTSESVPRLTYTASLPQMDVSVSVVLVDTEGDGSMETPTATSPPRNTRLGRRSLLLPRTRRTQRPGLS
jgi:hypothetical protein